MSWLFALGRKSFCASASTKVFPMSIQGWFLLWLTGLISLLSKGLKSLLKHHSSEASIFWHSVFLMVQLSHLYLTTGKTIALTLWTFVSKVMSLLFNTHSSFVIPSLPGSKCLISWLQSHLWWFWSPRDWNCRLSHNLHSGSPLIVLDKLHSWNGDNNSIYLMELLSRTNKVIHERMFCQCPE